MLRMALECIMIMLGEKQDWDTIKKQISETNFMMKVK
jgi:hypothetical protein